MVSASVNSILMLFTQCWYWGRKMIKKKLFCMRYSCSCVMFTGLLVNKLSLISCSCGKFARQRFIWNDKKYMIWLKLWVISAHLVCMCVFLLLWKDIHKLYLFKMLKCLSRLTRRKAINCDNTRRTWAHNDRSSVPTVAPRAKGLVLHNETICILHNTKMLYWNSHYSV